MSKDPLSKYFLGADTLLWQGEYDQAVIRYGQLSDSYAGEDKGKYLQYASLRQIQILNLTLFDLNRKYPDSSAVEIISQKLKESLSRIDLTNASPLTEKLYYMQAGMYENNTGNNAAYDSLFVLFEKSPATLAPEDIGLCYHQRGLYLTDDMSTRKESMHMYEKALEAADNARFLSRVARVWICFDFGDSKRINGEYSSAEDLYRRALPLISNAGPDSTFFSIHYLSRMGNIRNEEYNHPETVSYYKQALDALQVADLPMNELIRYENWSLNNNMGIAYMRRNIADTSNYYLNQSAKWLSSRDSSRICDYLINTSWNYMELRDMKSLNNNIRKLDTEYANIIEEDKDLKAEIYKFKVWNATAQKKFAEACGYLQVRLAVFFKNYNPQSQFDIPLANSSIENFEGLFALSDLANAMHKLGLLEQKGDFIYMAYNAFKVTDTIILNIRNSLTDENTHLDYNSAFHIMYGDYADCLTSLWERTKDNRYLKEIYAIFEKSKASDLTASVSSEGMQITDPSLGRAHDEMQSKLKKIGKELSDLELKISKGLSDPSLPVKREKARQRITSIIDQFTQENPTQGFAMSYGAPDFEEAINSLDDNTLVINYHLTRDPYALSGNHWRSLAFGNKEMAIFNGAYDDKLLENIRKLKKAVSEEAPNTVNAVSIDEYLSSAEIVYETLLAQALNLKPGATRLIIVPDDELWGLPFEVLPIHKVSKEEKRYDKLPYLLNKYTVSYTPSFEMTVRNIQSTDRYKSALFFGLTDQEAMKQTHLKMQPLLNTIAEGKAIASLSGVRCKSFTGNKANKKTFLKEATNYDILHLCLHADTDTRNRLNNYILFNTSQYEPDTLYGYQLYDLPLKAKLTVLSACNTGRGKIQKGEGMFSFARGFLFAGCPTVVMSYWQLNSAYSEAVFTDFYRNINAGNSIAKSLTVAKRNYLKQQSPQTAHPWYWAGLTVCGKG